DEIDKMSSDFRGDPAAALLEVLDPEQNSTFNDHYLDMDYDLSDVMFITTANDLSGIPLPLRDRMEILELSGYTEYEKLNIAVRYLVPRQLEMAGLGDVNVEITENAIRTVIHHYTKESGVRNLEREIGSVCRKVARRVLKEGKDKTYRIAAKNVPELLGVPRILADRKSDRDQVGLTYGLSVMRGLGGNILECEAIVVPGKGKVRVTGMIQKMMEESGLAAMTYIRSRQKRLGLEEDFHSKYDVHVHFPGAIGKDGNSAGVTMATSIASALTRIPVRNNVAMTGEITLRGQVGAIGGLKEKMLAAHRAGIDTILIPEENRRDLREIPRRVLQAMRIVLVEHMDEVLAEALVLSDPDALFGEGRTRPVEYRHGKLIEPEGPTDGPTPTAEAPGAQQ
ncbi:MAG: S16 family serine protease, partial [Myxococcota bacterium]